MKRILAILQDIYPQQRSEIKHCYNIAKKISYNVTKEIDADFKLYAQNAISELNKDVFDKRKAELISCVRKVGFWGIGDSIANWVKKIDSPSKFLSIFDDLGANLAKTIEKKNDKLFKSKYINAYAEKNKERLSKSLFNLRLAFYKFITPPTTNPKVKEIEDTIKKLGVEEVLLGNDEKNAKMIYDSLKIILAHNGKLPTKILVPLFPESVLSSAVGITDAPSDKFSAILIAPSNSPLMTEKFKNTIETRLKQLPDYNKLSENLKQITKHFLFIPYFSTKDARRIILHELGHINDSFNYPILRIQDLSQEDKLTIKNLTGYLKSDNILSEVFAELYAKLNAEGLYSLTNAEYNLLCRICNGDFNKTKPQKCTNWFKKFFNF